MIECDKIQLELDELKMKFSDCSPLEADSMRKVVDLMTALNECKCSCDSNGGVLSIMSFQFDSISDTIDNIDKLTDVYLSLNGESQSEGEMLEGKQVQFRNLGRYGFVIKNAEPGTYTINDLFGNDVTSIVFNSVYNPETKTTYFVSKEYAVPSSIYFKFVK